jgi:hypothetical protein
LAPDDIVLRGQRAAVDLEARADTQPAHDFIASLIASNPAALGLVADQWFYLALCERDLAAARSALQHMASDACQAEGIPFPRTWCEGVVARLSGDEAGAQQKFTQTRVEAEKMIIEQPQDGGSYCVLALTQAALGQRADALRNGERAAQLLPVSKDAIRGATLLTYVCLVDAWSGATESALGKLAHAAAIPAPLSYGNLRLHPFWDPLRDDARFEQVVATLAPK